MRLLLDTHAFLWWLTDDRALGAGARAAIAADDADVFVSAATGWEIAVKRAAGKLEAPDNLLDAVELAGFVELPIEIRHAVASAELPQLHRDPFDRLLVAQARLEGLTLVTADPHVRRYDVSILDAAL